MFGVPLVVFAGGAAFAGFMGLAGEGGTKAVLKRFGLLLVVFEAVLLCAYLVAHN